MLSIDLQPNKKIYFASDFHLGTFPYEQSRERERKIVRWLTQVQADAQVIFLVGDLFDFWFEYHHIIPKGFARFQGKVAALADAGIEIYFFTGNHDLWMADYFEKELNIKVIHEPVEVLVSREVGSEEQSAGGLGQENDVYSIAQFPISSTLLYIAHGDGLGPGDFTYKILKRFVFKNPLTQWLFRYILPPDWGMGLAQRWSRGSRLSNTKKDEEHFLGEDREWLFQYCKALEAKHHHDYYIFGHRHLPLNLPVTENSRYLNLGEWVHYCTFVIFDGQTMLLETFKESTIFDNR